MPIRMATAPVSWGVMEVEGWARKQTYGEVLDEMVKAGYSGTELGPYGFLPTDSEELKRELGKRGLTLLGAFVPLPLGRPDAHGQGMSDALATARLLAANGAPYLVLADEMNEKRMAIAGSAGPEDGFTEAQWEGAQKLISCIAKSARELGVRSVFHHHAGTYIETPGEVARLLEMTDSQLLGVCLDTGHYFYGGGDPVAFARAHAARIWHLHLKDIRAGVLAKVRREKIAYLEAIRAGVFSELGEGDVDLAGVIRELDAAGFDGWAVFEQDVDPTIPGTDPLASATRSREYLRRVAGV
ncbi:MAG TPA: TIM barrel protein [Bryobacteraceae bacterium]|nr:TIM barrel protein [Bryobacteraceae bacterium]